MIATTNRIETHTATRESISARDRRRGKRPGEQTRPPGISQAQRTEWPGFFWKASGMGRASHAPSPPPKGQAGAAGESLRFMTEDAGKIDPTGGLARRPFRLLAAIVQQLNHPFKGE